MEWDMIYEYSRRQAIMDGVLIDVSPLATECGFKYPVAVTSTLYQQYIVPSKKLKDEYGQSEQGRLWDLLSIIKFTAQRNEEDTMFFQVIFWMEENGKCVQKKVKIKAVVGPGDTLDAVVTIMLPNED